MKIMALKFSGAMEFKLPDEMSTNSNNGPVGIQSSIFAQPKIRLGKRFGSDDARGRYIARLKQVMPGEVDLSGMRIVVDCANGARIKLHRPFWRSLALRSFRVASVQMAGISMTVLGRCIHGSSGDAVRALARILGWLWTVMPTDLSLLMSSAMPLMETR